MRVRLMLTCLCDAFYGEVGIATVKVLEHAGCEVVFDDRQTCCGQPPFNAGDWESARKMASHARRVFEGDEPIVAPSASCAAMTREGYHLLGMPDGSVTKELCEFLLGDLRIQEWPSLKEPKNIGFHRSCHGRMIGLGSVQEQMLGLVGNLRLVPFGEPDQCCGFGGAFSVNYGETSRQIGLTKLNQLVKAGVTEVVSGDMGCLMHLDTLAQKEGIPIKATHLAEVLAWPL
jgi:L-lactate dehydrogenase complex protein LldE